MRRRNDAKPRPHGRVGAHWQHFAMIQHAQELQLQRGRHIGYLVEKQRAPVCLQQKSRAILHRAGERALNMPEQLGLCQRRTESPHVHRDHRHVSSRTMQMDCLGRQLLADPALALQQDRGIRVGRERNLLEHSLHCRRLPQHTLNRRRRGDLGTGNLAQRPVDRGANLGQIERLHHVFERTLANRLDRRRQIAERRDHDDRRAMEMAPKRLHRGEPVHPRQTHVQNEHIRPRRARQHEALFGRRCHIHRRVPSRAPAATGPMKSTVHHQQLEFWTRAHPFSFKGRPTRNRVNPFSRFHTIVPP